jgi:general secretion pathway protein E/type IV pilus assembly protein PilB
MDFTELGHFEIDIESVQLLPKAFCEQHRVCVLGRVHPQDRVTPVPVAMLDIADDALCRQVEQTLGRRVRPVQLNAYEIRRAIRKGFQLGSAGSRHPELFLDYMREVDFTEAQAPSKMVDDLLAVAITRGATDVHIETYPDDNDLRFRLDGVLRQITTPLSPDNSKQVISRIKILCGIDIAAKPQPMEGRFGARYCGEDGEERVVHFRVSIVPSPLGEDCVIRILDGAMGQLGLAGLGLTPNAMHVYQTMLRCPSGLILVTGPTGSGKTTTLYASIRDVQSGAKKICTVEDPIEVYLPKTNQMEVTPDNTFADFARAFLRQDPEVLMIGEIRDHETAEIAVRAAMTGHLVLSTLHTQDAVSVVSRLRTLGIDDETLSNVLIGSLAQRLLRLNCTECLEGYTPKAETFVRFFADEPNHRFMRGRGCKKCEGTGYRGRVGLFEVFVADDAVSAAIGAHEPQSRIHALASDRGYVPLVSEALERVARGLTTLDEVERTVMPLYFV